MSEHKFKVGDKIVIDGPQTDTPFKEGQVLTVERLSDQTCCIYVVGYTTGLSHLRFKLAPKVVSKFGKYILILEDHKGVLAPSLSPRVYPSEAAAQVAGRAMAQKHGGVFYVFKATHKYTGPQQVNVVEEVL